MKFCCINVKKINNLVFESYAIQQLNYFENDKCRHLSVLMQFFVGLSLYRKKFSL